MSPEVVRIVIVNESVDCAGATERTSAFGRPSYVDVQSRWAKNGFDFLLSSGDFADIALLEAIAESFICRYTVAYSGYAE